MPPIPAVPIAVTLPPSDNPYSFVEVTAFRGDFEPPLGFPNPKGMAYHWALDRLIVSLSPSGFVFGRNQVLNLVAADGTRAPFAPGFHTFREVESKIVVVPQSGPPVDAGFTPGDIFIGRGPHTEISRLSANGEVLAEVFTQLSPNSSLWGGLTFDTEGEFGGKMIAVESDGKIFLVAPDGSTELLTDLHLRLEGVAVAPVTFGPHAKNIIVGCEGYGDDDPHGGEIYAISKNLTVTLLANIGFAAEDIQFIPQGGATFYQTQICFDRERENRLLSVSASQFLLRYGKMIVNNELTGELWEVGWDGQKYTQQLAGRVPGRWSSQGFNWQGTEIESCCFAIKKPRIPNWNDWQTIPGTFLTDRAPSAATDPNGEVLLFGKGSSDTGVYLNRLRQPQQSVLPDPDGEPRSWQGWRRDPFSIITPHALSCSQHNQRMYAFAVKPEGVIQHKFFSPDETTETIQPWQDVPGTMVTPTAVTSATINGRLVLCALGQDRRIYLNELAPGGRYWGGWQLVPGGGSTDITPTVIAFQDELYLFIKGLTSKRVLMRTRTVNGDWTPYGEVPGAARTDSPITAITNEGQLFLFIKGANDRAPYVNVASETGSWSGWQMLPNPGSTDVALAAAPSGNRVYLFAKGINNPSIFVRSTF
ncbi:MAG: hypothetical protein KA368_07600 [Acidobacteria bacterium]|nr:hypothetical protein [Acidobacteriota bacterium]